MFRHSRAAVVVALLALTATACKKPPVVEPTQPDVVRTPPQLPPTSGSGNDSGTNPGVDPEARRRAIEATTKSLLDVVYFEYDVAELTLTAQAVLNIKVEIMRANPTVMVRIEGHCDSRGSTEYNLALGQRRAAAARQYLIDRGIPASRIQTLSMGEERPAMQGENEAAYSRNRRDEFTITAGSITTPVGN